VAVVVVVELLVAALSLFGTVDYFVTTVAVVDIVEIVGVDIDYYLMINPLPLMLD
jgi:hypothetical protein